MKSRFVVAQMEQNGDPEINLENARKAVAEAVAFIRRELRMRHSLRAPRLWMDRLQRK